MHEMPPKAKEFHERAKAFVAASGKDFALIQRNSNEHRAWEKYFRVWLDWMPWGMKQMALGLLETVTMPAQWPEWFDPHFGELDQEEIDRRNAIKLRPKSWVRPLRSDYEEMIARHGRPVGRFEEGTKWEHMAGRKIGSTRQILAAPTDAELKEIYGRSKPSSLPQRETAEAK